MCVSSVSSVTFISRIPSELDMIGYTLRACWLADHANHASLGTYIHHWAATVNRAQPEGGKEGGIDWNHPRVSTVSQLILVAVPVNMNVCVYPAHLTGNNIGALVIGVQLEVPGKARKGLVGRAGSRLSRWLVDWRSSPWCNSRYAEAISTWPRHGWSVHG